VDILQEQVSALSSKVDSLCQLIEQLSTKISDVAAECRLGSEPVHRMEHGTAVSYRSYPVTGELALGHKDVLTDDGHLDSMTQSGERPLSPEIQIQRLTAQLTAAYNRIAALEEQLLSQRIH